MPNIKPIAPIAVPITNADTYAKINEKLVEQGILQGEVNKCTFTAATSGQCNYGSLTTQLSENIMQVEASTKLLKGGAVCPQMANSNQQS